MSCGVRHRAPALTDGSYLRELARTRSQLAGHLSPVKQLSALLHPGSQHVIRSIPGGCEASASSQAATRVLTPGMKRQRARPECTPYDIIGRCATFDNCTDRELIVCPSVRLVVDI